VSQTERKNKKYFSLKSLQGEKNLLSLQSQIDKESFSPFQPQGSTAYTELILQKRFKFLKALALFLA
jgi:hypothetical protein